MLGTLRRLVTSPVSILVMALTWTPACSDEGKTGAGGAGGASSSNGGGGASSSNGSGGAGGVSSSNGGAGGASSSNGGGGSGASGGAGGAMSATCGDGVVSGSEACDDGNQASGDYCAADCSAVTGKCGDGVVQTNETCDDGKSTMGCDTLTDGGDGACVAPGTCSSGYVMVMGKCVPELMTEHVHINVSNTCQMSVMPMEYNVPAGQKLKLSYHNHSVDYPVDVWKSYGGGYLDLQPGATWNEMYEHCAGPQPSTAYADISTACSSFRLYIHCL